jgi:hypothetical protein
VAKVLVAVALSDEEAEALERAARMEGHGDLGRVLEKALRLYLEAGGGASISSRALYSSRQAGRIRGTVCP